MTDKYIGKHIMLDYTGYIPPVNDDADWILNIMKDAATNSGIRVVHHHVEKFDGGVSPPGFAAVVLVDESHITAHAYSKIGLLAIDVFTCGKHNPDDVASKIDTKLKSAIPSLICECRQYSPRFLIKSEIQEEDK
mgnify:CR=1 FL=1